MKSGIPWSLFLACACVIAVMTYLSAATKVRPQHGVLLHSYLAQSQQLFARQDPYTVAIAERQSPLVLSPTALSIFALLAHLPQPATDIWLVLQCALLLLAIYLSALGTTSRTNRYIIWGVLLTVIGGNLCWHAHIIRQGELLILPIILTLLSYLFVRRKNSLAQLGGGILYGLAVALYFPLLLGILPMLLARRSIPLLGSAIGAIGMITATMFFANPTIWHSYFTATTAHTLQKLAALPTASIVAGGWSLPTLLGHWLSPDLTLIAAKLLMGLFVIAAGIILNRYRKAKLSTSLVFVLILLLAYVGGCVFLPLRSPATNLLWLPLLAFVFIKTNFAQIFRDRTTLLLAFACCSSSLMPWAPALMLGGAGIFFLRLKSDKHQALLLLLVAGAGCLARFLDRTGVLAELAMIAYVGLFAYRQLEADLREARKNPRLKRAGAIKVRRPDTQTPSVV